MMSLAGHGAQQGSRLNLANIELTRNYSEAFRAECKRLIEEADKGCKRMQNDDKKRLNQRVKDIQVLKEELHLKLAEIVVEIDGLIVLQSRLQKSLEASMELLKVVILCLEERMKRVPPERVVDEVAQELLKEKEATEGAVAVLQHVIEQLTEQIRLNRSAKYHLEQDRKEKFDAECIDKSCALMALHSTDNQNRSTDTKSDLPSMAVTPVQWECISDINIAKAEKQRNNSLSLRALADSLLKQTAADMQRQYQATTAAFQRNVQEIKRAKSQMEDQLAKIMSELSDQQKSKQDLLMAITENELCLKLAQSRLALRSHRPSKERCNDPPQSQLLAEVQQITANINTLRKCVAQSDEKTRALHHCQRQLEENIAMKESSLYIDDVICSQHRQPIVIRNF